MSSLKDHLLNLCYSILNRFHSNSYSVNSFESYKMHRKTVWEVFFYACWRKSKMHPKRKYLKLNATANSSIVGRCVIVLNGWGWKKPAEMWKATTAVVEVANIKTLSHTVHGSSFRERIVAWNKFLNMCFAWIQIALNNTRILRVFCDITKKTANTHLFLYAKSTMEMVKIAENHLLFITPVHTPVWYTAVGFSNVYC